MDSDPLAALDAHAQAALVTCGEMRPEDLVAASLARIERLNDTLNAVSALDGEGAVARARRVDCRLPFAGVPILLKDSTEYPGLAMSSGSRAYAGRVGARTPAFVARLEAAGLVVVGKSNMPEGGFLPSSESLFLGAVHNPWNGDYSAGGSSGGAAAAVAAGLTPLAQGSDGGGSIRIPAAACGVFGLKPSRGRQARIRAADPIEDLLVADLPLTRSVRDAAAMLTIVDTGPTAGLPPVGAVSGPSARRLHIGVTLTSLHGLAPDAEVRDAVLALAQVCADLGHTVFEVEPRFDGAALLDAFVTMWMDLASQYVAAAPSADDLESWTIGLAEASGQRPPGARPRALAIFDEVRHGYNAAFANLNLILTPVVRGVCPLIGRHAPDRPFEQLMEDVFDHISYTPLHNAVGAPAMSVPAGRDRGGLPLGAMFAARVGDERTLLQLAYELEEAGPWLSLPAYA